MKHDNGEQNRWRMLVLLIAAGVCSLLVVAGGRRLSATATGTSAQPAAPNPVQISRRPWTGIGSTGAVDESALSIYAVNGAELGFKSPGSGGIIVARYNVTNTFDNNANPNQPGWTTLEMGSKAPINTIVRAKLFRVKFCTSDPVLLCVADNRSSDHPCATCTFASGSIDFSDSLYFVEVSLDRSSSLSSMPTLYTLRVY